MRVILASSSPRRREIMKLLGLDFEVIPPKAEEKTESNNPVLLARKLAREKAYSVWRENRDALVIGADTVVFFNGRVIGKPSDEEEAFSILRMLSGNWHTVVTGVALFFPGGKVVFHDAARVKFRDLEEEEIRRYVKSGEPMDKAGAYGVQGFGATLVEKIRGNFYTVMGLPVARIYTVLRGLGFT
ncbi:MAG: septum formation protein Maf [Aquificae bacterium]|nr:septum formation protein Maf [Aquificota bacterium]